MRISKIEKGVDLYNQILNSDKTKLLEKNKELSQDIERYVDENNEIRMLLENREQEIEIISKSQEIYLEKVKIGALKILLKVNEKCVKRVKMNVLQTLRE